MAQHLNPFDSLRTQGSLLNSMLQVQNKPPILSQPGNALIHAGKGIKGKDNVSRLISGLLQGFGSGQNSAEAHEAQEKQSAKQDAVMEQMKSLLQMTNQLGAEVKEKQEQAEKATALQDQYFDQAVAYLRNPNSVDPTRMVDGYNQLYDTHYVFLNTHDQDPATFIVKDQDSGQIRDIFIPALFNQDQQKVLMSQLPESRQMEELKRKKQQQDMNIAQSQEERAQSEFTAKQTQLPQAQQKALMDQYTTLKEAEKELELYNQAEQVLTSSKGKDGTIGFMRQLVEAAGGELAKGQRAPEQAQLEQIASDLRGKIFKRNQFRNEAEFKSIKTVDPTLSKDANLQLIAQKKAELAPLLEKKQALEAQLFGQGERQPIEQNKETISAAPQQETLEAIAPSGKPIRIPNDPALIDQLLQEGGQLAK